MLRARADRRRPRSRSRRRRLRRLARPSADDCAAGAAHRSAHAGHALRDRAPDARWLDAIRAGRRGWPPRGGAGLRGALRYAAGAGVDAALVGAGGWPPAGTASRAVLVFEPGSNRVRRVGTLPAPTTHAAAGAIGTVAYVIGGRGASAGTQTGRIVAIDPRARRVRPAGNPSLPPSALPAASLPARIPPP